MSDNPDSSDPDAASFEIVPGRRRKDGWTAERQQLFISMLRKHACVEKAARAAGLSRESAYRLRRRPGAESFAAAWDQAMRRAPSRGPGNPTLWWHRAIHGTMKPIVRSGQVVATLHRPDNKAGMRLLRHLDRAEARSAARKCTVK